MLPLSGIFRSLLIVQSIIKKTKGERVFIPDPRFDGVTPRLSCIGLRNCGISWSSPLLKGLKYLEILTLSAHVRPELTVWLDALIEMEELRALTLHSPTSPRHPPFPSDVWQAHGLTFFTYTLGYIGRFRGLCARTYSSRPTGPHLPCLTVIANLLSDHSVEELVPYITRHSHGPQDAQPLQSVLILTGSAPTRADIYSWSVPEFDIEVHSPPTLLATTVPTRVALSFGCHDWPLMEYTAEIRVEILHTAMAGLPLENLVTLVAHNRVAFMKNSSQCCSSGYPSLRSGPCFSVCDWDVLQHKG